MTSRIILCEQAQKDVIEFIDIVHTYIRSIEEKAITILIMCF